jgi:drug/metabolite transporter (DMT)-like permease
MNLRALLAAGFTIAIWASLALLTDRVSHLPPVLASGIALMVGGAVGAWQPQAWQAPRATYVLGVAGLLGYHALLFAAFGLAPAVEANLLQYLWPLLIVVLSPLFLPGNRLRVPHIVGALLGFGGAALIIGADGVHLDARYLSGYACAVAAALTWAVYSLGCRRLPPFPTAAIAACCLVAGAIAVTWHLARHGWPSPMLAGGDLGLLVLLGLGPMGVAFLTWDIALKHGDPRAIGALSYLTPLLSTLLLTLCNGRALTPQSLGAMCAIFAGALLGNADAIRGLWHRGDGLRPTSPDGRSPR